MTCVLHLMKKYKNRIIATLIALAVIISGANWVMRIAVGVQRTTAHVASRASKASSAKNPPILAMNLTAFFVKRVTAVYTIKIPIISLCKQ